MIFVTSRIIRRAPESDSFLIKNQYKDANKCVEATSSASNTVKYEFVYFVYYKFLKAKMQDLT